MPKKYFYYLSYEDIINVAEEEINRKLTKKEIEAIAERVPDYVPWYDIISDTIHEIIGHDFDKDDDE